MKRCFKILILFLFFGINSAHAQVGLHIENSTESFQLRKHVLNIPSIYPTFILYSDYSFQNPLTFNSNLNNIIQQPKIYDYHNLALFCKLEVQLEKATKFPVKFRLGDVEYVDQLEGK